MKLQLATWPEVEAYLKTRNDIIIPIGSTEQHGPMGLIGTDAQTAEGVAWGVGEKMKAYVAPTISVGMALHHMGFPGTISLKPSTLIAVICDNVVSLARHGFRKFYFINGHGGNIATANAAFAEAYHELQSVWGIDDVMCELDNWFIKKEPLALARELFGDEEGFHATPGEVSVTQYLYPEHIKTCGHGPTNLVDEHAPVYGSKLFRKTYPDGRMGSNSSLASPEAGKQILDVAVEACAKGFAEFIR